MLNINIIVLYGDDSVEREVELDAWDLDEFITEAQAICVFEAEERGWDLGNVTFKIDQLDSFDDGTIIELIEGIYQIVDIEDDFDAEEEYRIILTDSETIIADSIQQEVEKYIDTGVSLGTFCLEKVVGVDSIDNTVVVAYK